MKVCKFGGSSLANATQLNKVIDIVLSDPARRIVVVSAPGARHAGDTKVTDLLIKLAQTALKGENTDRKFGEVLERYAKMAEELKLGDEYRPQDRRRTSTIAWRRWRRSSPRSSWTL